MRVYAAMARGVSECVICLICFSRGIWWCSPWLRFCCSAPSESLEGLDEIPVLVATGKRRSGLLPAKCSGSPTLCRLRVQRARHLLSFPREAEPPYPRASSSAADGVPIAPARNSRTRHFVSRNGRRSSAGNACRREVRLLSPEPLVVAGVLPFASHGCRVRNPFDLCHARAVAAERRRHLSAELFQCSRPRRSIAVQRCLSRSRAASPRVDEAWHLFRAFRR